MSDFHLFSPKSFELGRSNSGSPAQRGQQNPVWEDYESSVDLETASSLRPDSHRRDSGSGSSRTSSVVDSPSIYKTIHR